MKPAKFRYVRAERAEHAVELLGTDRPSARLLAGGQSLIPALSSRSVTASLLIDIMRCPDLDHISLMPGKVAIGAACRQSDVESSPLARRSLPLLCEALGWVAMPQIRSRGTVVGCLAQANPGGEVPVVALALDAEVDILLGGGVRTRMTAREFYAVETSTQLPAGALIRSAFFRAISAGEGWGFCEVQLRPGHFALVCCAASMGLNRFGTVASATIAVGGLSANPYRAARAEKAMIGQPASANLFREAAYIASEECPWQPRTDLHTTGTFRLRASSGAVAAALRDAWSRCSPETGESAR